MSHFDEAAARWDDEPRRVALMKAIGEKIVTEVGPRMGMNVLDYGCGTGLVSLYLLPHVRHVTGADNSPGMLDVLRKKIAEGGIQNMEAVQLDLERDVVPEGRYQMVVVSMAMHHIGNVQKVLGAFYQLLEPGGRLCLADLDTEPGTFHPAEVAGSVHHHGFDREALKKRLAEIGFCEAKDTTVTTFLKPVEKGGEEEFSIFLVTARR
jgi:ubiquinone/menaquinone biosynthesis C-methylase UbiE